MQSFFSSLKYPSIQVTHFPVSLLHPFLLHKLLHSSVHLFPQKPNLHKEQEPSSSLQLVISSQFSEHCSVQPFDIGKKPCSHLLHLLSVKLPGNVQPL